MDLYDDWIDDVVEHATFATHTCTVGGPSLQPLPSSEAMSVAATCVPNVRALSRTHHGMIIALTLCTLLILA